MIRGEKNESKKNTKQDTVSCAGVFFWDAYAVSAVLDADEFF